MRICPPCYSMDENHRFTYIPTKWAWEKKTKISSDRKNWKLGVDATWKSHNLNNPTNHEETSPITQYRNVFYVTFILLYYYNRKYFLCLNLYKITCMLQYPFRNTFAHMNLTYRQGFCLEKESRRAFGFIPSSLGVIFTSERGILNWGWGEAWRKRMCAYCCVCLGVCVCLCLQKLFSSQCWEQLQAGLPVLHRKQNGGVREAWNNAVKVSHHPG